MVAPKALETPVAGITYYMCRPGRTATFPVSPCSLATVLRGKAQLTAVHRTGALSPGAAAACPAAGRIYRSTTAQRGRYQPRWRFS